VGPDISIIESLSRNCLQVPAEHRFTATLTFLAQDANKAYTIVTADGGGIESQLPYMFRLTLPAGPFHKTTSEMATLSYIREHTSVPVPRMVTYSSTAENELGFEWILMEKIPGVSLKSVRREVDMGAREIETRVVARYAKQLRDLCSFDAIGNPYFRKDLSGGIVRTVPITDEEFVIEPIATAFIFAGGRKLRLPSNLGPYNNDAEYMAVLVDVETEGVKFLRSPEARTHDAFNEDVIEGAPETLRALKEFWEVWASLFLEKMVLRRPWDEELGNVDHWDEDGVEKALGLARDRYGEGDEMSKGRV
jgi:hypothetical protein